VANQPIPLPPKPPFLVILCDLTFPTASEAQHPSIASIATSRDETILMHKMLYRIALNLRTLHENREESEARGPIVVNQTSFHSTELTFASCCAENPRFH
jgi:hypothetical protein